MKKIYTILVTLVFSLIFIGESVAQDPHYSQFYAAPLHVNPAMSGVYDGAWRATANYRDQWSSIIPGNSFRTIGASFDGRFHIVWDDYFSVGLAALRDEAGEANFSQTRVHLTASYMKQLGSGRYRSGDQYLVAGAQLGFGQNSINWSQLWFSRQFDAGLEIPNPGAISSGEPNIQGDNQTTDPYMDVNAGLLYYALFDENRSFYIGGALHHLNAPKISFLGDGQEELYLKWTGHVGGEVPFSDELSLLPAAIAMGQGPSMQVVGGGNFRYTNRDWRELALRLGGWARVANQLEDSMGIDALIVTAVLEMESWNLGISYDITLSSLTDANNSRGGFEVSLIYVHPSGSRVKVGCPNF